MVNESAYAWYKGRSLYISETRCGNGLICLPVAVQWVVRPQTDDLHDYKAAAHLVANYVMIKLRECHRVRSVIERSEILISNMMELMRTVGDATLKEILNISRDVL